MTIEENIEEIGEIVELGRDTDVTVEAGIGMSFFSPYEGKIAPEQTLDVVEAVLDNGVDKVTLATSMGMANPAQIDEVVTQVYEQWPKIDLGLHLHDTNGMSLANTLVAMQLGVRRFDSSVCGLGGGVILPDEMESIGNTPTEDLLHMLQEMGIETGVDFDAIEAIAHEVMTELELPPISHVLKGGTRTAVFEHTS
jgi:hydroxymethylglutaryl-CoA lyase